jgi:hypothetical protein
MILLDITSLIKKINIISYEYASVSFRLLKTKLCVQRVHIFLNNEFYTDQKVWIMSQVWHTGGYVRFDIFILNSPKMKKTDSLNGLYIIARHHVVEYCNFSET